jgi:hypothetical protein
MAFQAKIVKNEIPPQLKIVAAYHKYWDMAMDIVSTRAVNYLVGTIRANIDCLA